MWRIVQHEQGDDFVLATGITQTVRSFVEKAFTEVDTKINWTGEGVDEETSVARSIVRTALKTSWGAKSPKWAEFTGLEDAVQAEKLDKVRADNPGLFDQAIADKLAERKRDRETKAKLGKAIAINI